MRAKGESFDGSFGVSLRSLSAVVLDRKKDKRTVSLASRETIKQERGAERTVDASLPLRPRSSRPVSLYFSLASFRTNESDLESASERKKERSTRKNYCTRLPAHAQFVDDFGNSLSPNAGPRIPQLAS